MSNQKYFAASTLLVSLLAADFAFAGMATDEHGNVGYDTAAECDAAVASGTTKFYKSFTHKPALLRAGEARFQVMSLKDLAISQDIVRSLNYSSRDYTRGACDIGAARKGGRDGVAKPLQGKYVPYSPDMPINVYFNPKGTPVRATMQQCDNWFGAAMPRPIPGTPVAEKAAPETIAAPAATPTVEPPAVPAPVQTGALAAHGAIGLAKLLGVGGLIAAGALVINNNSDTGTTGTAGTVR